MSRARKPKAKTYRFDNHEGWRPGTKRLAIAATGFAAKQEPEKHRNAIEFLPSEETLIELLAVSIPRGFQPCASVPPPPTFGIPVVPSSTTDGSL